MEHKKVVVFNGDDASPEVMIPTVEILEEMELPIIFEQFVSLLQRFFAYF